MVGVSVPDWIKGIYKSKGWHLQQPSYLNRRHGVRVMVSPDQSSAVIIIPPFRIKPPVACGASPQSQFDEYLRKIQKGMEGLLSSGMSITDAYFTGGGPLVIPDWFTAWCKRTESRFTLWT